MNRAKPTDMRKAMMAVHELKKAGILFVPMPVIDNEDGDALRYGAVRRLDVLVKQAEAEKLFSDDLDLDFTTPSGTRKPRG